MVMLKPAIRTLDTTSIKKEVQMESYGPVLLFSEASEDEGVRLQIRDDKSLLGSLQEAPPYPDITETSLQVLTAKPLTSRRSSEDMRAGDGRLGIKKLGTSKATSPNRQGPQQCQVCGKVFGNASALAKHKLTHSDERKYVCSMCGKAFKRQDHLNGHMLTHRNKKPYECKAEGCGKSYCDARSLRRHTENHHIRSRNTSPEPGSEETASVQATADSSRVGPLQSTNNERLTKQQIELIHQIMERTQQALPEVDVGKSEPVYTCIENCSTSSCKPWNVQTIPSFRKTLMCNTKPVECNLCQRKFKNIPALNGHMRLHGGYFKKEAEPKKSDRREVSGPPLQTASINVRALIEEKIILKRFTKPGSIVRDLEREDGEGVVKQEVREDRKTLALCRTGVKRSSESGILHPPACTSVPLNLQDINCSVDKEDGGGLVSTCPLEDVFQHGHIHDSVLIQDVGAHSLADAVSAMSDIDLEELQNATESGSEDLEELMGVGVVPPLVGSLAAFTYTTSRNETTQLTTQTHKIPDPHPQSTKHSKSQPPGVPSAGDSPPYMMPHMMPNSVDPLLSSSSKDTRKIVDFQTIKLIHNSVESGFTQSLPGIILDRNGELKIVHAPMNGTFYINLKPEYDSNFMKTLSIENKIQFVKKKIDSVTKEDKLEEEKEGRLLEQTFVETAPHGGYKRQRWDYEKRSSAPHRSRLRSLSDMSLTCPFRYTPPPILSPERAGHGLYRPPPPDSGNEECGDVGRSDPKPHINIGPEFQCEIPPCQREKKGNDGSPLREYLLWDSRLNSRISDKEVEMYLEFACCAAVPGGGRNKEHALHLLNICNGKIHEAMLRLMRRRLVLPEDHQLLQFDYRDSQQWSLTEMDNFHQALLKHDKNFASISHEISSKSPKQCIQFYYIWKKVCPEEYKKLRHTRRRQFCNNLSEDDPDSIKTEKL